MATPGKLNDVTLLVPMPDEMQDAADSTSRTAYLTPADAEYGSWMILWTGTIPNTRQRQGAANRATPNRKKAARLFNRDEYRIRALMEGVFGAEESRRRHLHCRFIRTDNRLRFAKGRAIAWNVRAPSRFEWANRLKAPPPSSDGQQMHAERA